MEHCLHEWDSGIRVEHDLDEKVDTARYRAHLDHHTKWKQTNEDMTTLALEHVTGMLL